MSATLNEVVQFLLGTGELEGYSFGDIPPGEKSRFWWRRHLREAYRGGLNVQHPELVRIKNEVSVYYGIEPDVLAGTKRATTIVHARQMAMFLSRALTSFSMPEIADIYNKDHTTVVHAVEQIKFRINNTPRIHKQYEELKQRLEVRQ